MSAHVSLNLLNELENIPYGFKTTLKSHIDVQKKNHLRVRNVLLTFSYNVTKCVL